VNIYTLERAEPLLSFSKNRCGSIFYASL